MPQHSSGKPNSWAPSLTVGAWEYQRLGLPLPDLEGLRRMAAHMDRRRWFQSRGWGRRVRLEWDGDGVRLVCPRFTFNVSPRWECFDWSFLLRGRPYRFGFYVGPLFVAWFDSE